MSADMSWDKDVEQIITWGLKEANPRYPVHLVRGREDFRRRIALLRS